MTSPTIVHPDTGRVYRLGRVRPKPSNERKFHVPAAQFFRSNMPTRPRRVSYGDKAHACLKQPLCNMDLGCCTASGAFHIEGIFRGNAGTPVTFSDDQVISFYSATTGYKRGVASTDNGGDEVTVLDWWRTHGLYSSGKAITPDAVASPETHRLAGHLSASSSDELKNCINVFENGYLGLELPDDWIRVPPSGDGYKWGVAGNPNPDNGHCDILFGYDDDEDDFDTDSWGLLGKTTAAAVDKYGSAADGGEMHVLVSQDALIKAIQKFPVGIDWDAVVNVFASLGGNIPPALQHMVG